MDIRIFVEPQQGASYGDQLAVAQLAERLGFDAFFRSDHFVKMGDVDGLPGPTDAWVTLGALARETETIRLGTLVTSATFRLPGPLAIAVAQVDEMSNGRVELGLGTGWFDEEHRAYGIPFADLGERFDILDEQLQILHGLWSTRPGETFDFAGEHYTLENSPALPKPHQPGGPPVIIGGIGPKRTPELAARSASEFNQPFVPMEYFTEQRARVDAACEAIDRDPSDMIHSVALVVCAGSSDHEVAVRAAGIGREMDELIEFGLCGQPAQIIDRLADWAEAGAQRVYLQVLDLRDLDHISLLGEDVVAVIKG